MSDSIRKAVPQGKSHPIIAVKFINKQHALRVGRIREDQIRLEVGLHSIVSANGGHQNIVQFLNYGSDPNWYWIAMQLADGGDLFDKIEADEGVPEPIAQFYFIQLINAITWCHSKGVAHRDIKPENMLLSADGDLKLADFGLACQFLDLRNGSTKRSTTVCGSPPYAAPEIFAVGEHNQKIKQGKIAGEQAKYQPELTDYWSCAVVLFVLLAGNTPWDIPDVRQSYEFEQFIKTDGKPMDDELWQRIPPHALSLLRGILKVDPTQRFNLQATRAHPWFTAPNKYMNNHGRSKDSVALATVMMERLKIDIDTTASQPDAMQIDSTPDSAMGTPPPADPIEDAPVDWEAPPRFSALAGMSASQPDARPDQAHHNFQSSTQIGDVNVESFSDQLSQDPTMSQFSQVPKMHLTLTQAARRFGDIAPSYGMTRFYSRMPVMQLLAVLESTLRALSIDARMSDVQQDELYSRPRHIRIKATDSRKQPLFGNVFVEIMYTGADPDPRNSISEVRFNKDRGDPLEWRRLFKQVVRDCGHVVCRPT